ncbi:MAG: carbamoyltransferase HypF, partial [Thermoproteota archaeon]
MRAEITVTGIVQGVGFRPFIYRLAVSHGLVGFVQNRGDATVFIVVEGDESSIRRFMREIREKKPPLARIFSLEAKLTESRGEFSRFEIRRSSSKRSRRASIIPPDVSICDDCIREMRDHSDRRYSYFFITCTNCGPRFTVIEKLPYDRPNTTMIDFQMCSHCRKEYENPLDRRFHAQTIACPACGPRAYLTDKSGEEIDVEDPVREVGKLLDEGHVVAVKGIGGFHLATATTISEPILRLRAAKHRRQKPFAIMARDLDAVKTFAEVTPPEEAALKSYMRPIVLLKKSESYYLSDQISPGLHTVGVMLPYTGMHIMMFDWSREPAFVMTSANPPDEPIVKDNSEAIRKLGSIVDYFLLHNRRIAQRCDDSVLRVVAGSPALIRRSRGYAPAPIELRRELKAEVLALGGEKRVTSCILAGRRCFASQHIGDVEKLETLRYLREATGHLLKLVGAEPSVIACDLHPAFHTTRLARRLAEELGVPLERVQHHHAHIASLMAEKGLDELVGLSCDGYGYGPGGKAWGGEVLYCSREGYR